MTFTTMTYADKEPLRLDRYLKRTYPLLAYSVIQKWARTGALRVNGQRAKADYRLQLGDVIKTPSLKDDLCREASPSKSIPALLLKKVKTWVVYEDEEIIAFNKPAGMAVQGGTGITFSLDDMAKQAFNNKEIRVVHRLDKDTSGLLIMAKDRGIAQKLAQAFHDQAVKKTYVALVLGEPRPRVGRIENYLSKKTGDIEKIAVVESSSLSRKDWAVTDYKVIQFHKDQGLAWVHLYPQTGRMHQLRVHMAHGKTPILGDGKYGGAIAHPFATRTGLALHAAALLLPSGLELTVPEPTWFHTLFSKGLNSPAL